MDAGALEQIQYLTFLLAGEEYAVNVLRVKEIIEYDTLTKMPNSPPAVRGVINLRGSVIPVVDLAVMFGLDGTRVTKFTCVVILEVGRGDETVVMGVMTDAVNQVTALAAEDIEKVPAFGAQVRGEFLQGMGRSGKKFILILDIDRLLSEENLRSAVPSAVPENGERGTAPAG